MQLSDYLSENLIFLDLDAHDKYEAFRAMVAKMATQQAIAEPATFLHEVIEREAIEPTCIGRGVALPHTRTRCVKKPIIAFARTSRSIPFTAACNDGVQLIFMMGTPKDEANQYLQILARLCRLLRRSEFRDKLLTATSPKEILKLFDEFDTPLN
ncbi:MAG: PTS sugar transporter subunit IIA [candidate division KSB1 bacterium]|nr:PTS sugar transporter subunit IIA [candidate division KSB1 bacterium]MDZ7274588.1 PTS sugar transporter subunit IIA [candidate division KSB1 bacterium]MDZ7284751.1 PTS sugar transporter subunit IIA [candidate division KSB1 bacterium]MDZ7297829.1 PTS sugar transporter subunit IIA [candidate division KSB1 bacterium]MDZ7308870.1 PTS sugar transporter subunit IIA [candidate division KSB1 bacterium]